jgi:chromosome segregation ATPase
LRQRRHARIDEDGDMEQDLAELERKLTTLIAHTRALRAANETLRRDLATAHERNRDLTSRVQQAGARLDALIARIPAE